MESGDASHQPGDTGVAKVLQLLRRRWFIILLFTVTLPVVAFYAASQQSPRYEAEAAVILTVGADDLIPGSAEGVNQPAERLANTMAELARSPALLAELQDRIGDVLPAVIERDTSVEPAENRNLLLFRAEGSTRAEAERLATAYAEVFPEYLQRLRVARLESLLAQIDQRRNELLAEPGVNAEAIDSLESSRQQLFALQAVQQDSADFLRPASEAEQIHPRVILSTAAGLLVGLLLGSGLAVLLELLDTRVREASELEDVLGVPLLGRIRPPRRAAVASSRLVSLLDDEAVHAEEFRTLAVNLDFETIGKRVRAVQVSSALMGEGKSTTIANLAVTLARQGRNVIVIDGDLRRPSLHQLFAVPRSPGLSEAVLAGGGLEGHLIEVHLNSGAAAGRVRIPKASGAAAAPTPATAPASVATAPAVAEAWPVGEGRLRILPAGQQPPQVGDFLTRRQVVQAVRMLTHSCDLLLVDSPPLLGIGDGLRATAMVDALIIVSNIRLLRQDDVQELSRTLRSAPVDVLGFVTTGVTQESQRYRYYAESTRRRRRLLGR